VGGELSADIGYINARLKGMHSRFLKDKDWEELLNAYSLDDLFTRLKKTIYGEQVEESLKEKSGLEALDHALSLHWMQTVLKVQSFLKGPLTLALNAYFWRIDLANLKAILIALIKGVEIPEAPPVVGTLNRYHLEELARLKDLNQIKNMLVAWGHPFRELLSTLPEGTLEPKTLELFLEKGFFQMIRKKLKGPFSLKASIRNYWKTEVDLLNIRSALFLENLPDRSNPEKFFIPGGRFIGVTEFVRLSNKNFKETTWRRIARIEDMRFLQSVKGIEDLERIIPGKRLENLRRRYRVDPLGAGVLMAFLEEKEFEITNIRLIGRSIYYQIPPTEVKAYLVI
jgi:V/A-type H+-transporting ATPase subunit C